MLSNIYCYCIIIYNCVFLYDTHVAIRLRSHNRPTQLHTSTNRASLLRQEPTTGDRPTDQQPTTDHPTDQHTSRKTHRRQCSRRLFCSLRQQLSLLRWWTLVVVVAALASVSSEQELKCICILSYRWAGCPGPFIRTHAYREYIFDHFVVHAWPQRRQRPSPSRVWYAGRMEQFIVTDFITQTHPAAERKRHTSIRDGDVCVCVFVRHRRVSEPWRPDQSDRTKHSRVE